MSKGDTAGALPAPRHRYVLGAGRDVWIQYGAFFLTLILVLSPIAPIVYQSLLDRPLYETGGIFTVDNYVKLFTQAGFSQVILNSLYFGVLTTVIAVAIAVIMAVLLVRVRIPMGRAMATLLLWPIYISPLVLAFGWMIVYSPGGFVTVGVRNLIGITPWNLYSIPGMAVTEAVALVPIGYLYCSGALRLADSSLENVARTCGAGPFRILWSIVVPMLRPPVLYSALFIFSTSIETLSIPLLYGRPVGIDMFASFIYLHGVDQSNPDYGLLGAASVFTLGVLAILVSFQAWALRNAQRFVSVRGKATRPQLLQFGSLRWVGFSIAIIYIILGSLIPLLGLLARAFTKLLTPLVSPFSMLTFDNFTLVFSYPAYVASIENSVLIAVLGAIATTLFAAVAVLVVRRSEFRFARPLEFTALSPQVIPGIILGIGFFWAFALISPLRPIRATIVSLIIAFGVRSLPVAFGAIAPIIMQVSRDLDYAARTVGADWWHTFSRILLRLVVPGLFAAITLVFVQMIKEFTPALFLATADTQVIGTTTLQLWLNGNSGPVAALSCVQIAITAIFVLVARKLLKVKTDA